MFNTITNKKLILATALLLIISLFFFSSIFLDTNNPFPVIGGIIKLSFSHENIVKIPFSSNEYITKGKDKVVISEIMKTRGYELVDQLGSGYAFENKNSKTRIFIVDRHFSRFYNIWFFGQIVSTTQDISN